jgi:hypothetical protein
VLLAARLEQLPADERAVLEWASVIGKSFSWAPVAALAAEAERDRLSSYLASLVRRDLLRQDTSELAGEDAFQFRHDLIRDAAYQALPKRDRAELHERLAMWLQQASRERMQERQELLGYHLEQAYRSRAELGPPDDHARTLARAAAEQLGAAGQRALARDDGPGAANLLGRAVALLPANDPARLQLLPGLGAALIGVNALEQASAVLGEAATVAGAAGEERLAWRASLDHSWLRFRIDPGHESAEAGRLKSEQAIARLTELDDALALAKAWLLLGEVHNLGCQFATMGEAAERAIEYAQREGATHEMHQGLGDLLLALRFGPIPVAEALRRCAQLREHATGDHFAELSVRLTIAALQAMQGRFREARELFAQVSTVVEDVGLAWAWPFTLLSWHRAELERLAGDLAAAERGLRLVYEDQRQAGDEGYLASTAVELADVLAHRGHDDEALQLTEISEAAAAPDDIAAQFVWRRVRARVIARRGSLQEAERLARDAVGLAKQTDYLQGHGDALMDLAEVLRLASRTEDAADAARQALVLYDQKGNLALADRARHVLHELARR